MPTELKLPELGENITAGDVVRVLVKPGDTIAKDQAVLELETDKATIEVPSSVAGVVKDVQVAKAQPEGAPEEGGISQRATADEKGSPSSGGAEARADREGNKDGKA